MRLLTAFLFLASTLTYASERYTFTGAFSYSQLPGHINVGDNYALSFDYDTSGIDELPDLDGGVFFGAISNLTFSLSPGATGTYSGGTMTGSQFLHLTEHPSGHDQVNFYASPAFLIPGLNFANAGSHQFAEFEFTLYSTTNVFSLPNALGDSLSTVLPKIDLASYSDVRVGVIFDDFRTNAFASIDSITNEGRESPSVPEEGNVALLMTAALASLVGVSRRMRTVRGV